MFWKKKDKSEASKNPFETDSPSNTAASTYSPAPAYTSQPQQDYSSANGRYGRYNDADENNQRNALFDGRNNYENSTNRQVRYGSKETDSFGRSNLFGNGNEEEENDEAVQVAGIKQQIRNVKQDSLASTRAALQKLNETEATASTTMNMLGQQSSQIANVNRHLDLSKAYSDRAANQADELKQLNRSIFIPVVSNPFRKKEKQRRELEAKQRDYAEHMAERDQIRQFEYESNARIQETARLNNNMTRAERRGRSEADRRRYQFEEDSEDDAIEDEIDSNLDLISGATSRLKNMALTMNTELDRQNLELNKTLGKVDPLTQKLVATTDKLNRTR
ncbi:hypothetical protein BDF20DRAFT_869876 [Mycotypha africana]|uniref:uncharacterized protein n=1 Tax=Mycotypha africana TaxID=64632 RepID=UPI002301EE2E|nr:uncharacterized protein BDF20DRAFT_869876 [Mycotypha africana]KAI8979487.1 hypothetical protein BDF20DRAFT_869876 [Mycotypha africana]